MESNLFCVRCGKQNIPEDWRRFRCKPCWEEFVKEGGIRKIEEPIVNHQGIRMGGHITFENYARHCRTCGAKMDEKKSQRVRFALLRGSECLYCDDCDWKKKMEGVPPLANA